MGREKEGKRRETTGKAPRGSNWNQENDFRYVTLVDERWKIKVKNEKGKGNEAHVFRGKESITKKRQGETRRESKGEKDGDTEIESHITKTGKRYTTRRWSTRLLSRQIGYTFSRVYVEGGWRPFPSFSSGVFFNYLSLLFILSFSLLSLLLSVTNQRLDGSTKWSCRKYYFQTSFLRAETFRKDFDRWQIVVDVLSIGSWTPWRGCREWGIQ